MATIIKANQVSNYNNAISYNLDDFSDQATDSLEKVTSQAADIVKAAHAEAAIIREQAILEAKQEAAADLAELISKQVHSQLTSANPVIQQVALELQKTRHEWMNYWRESIMKLSIKIAERIIHREVAINPAINVDLVNRALGFSVGETSLKIYVHPQDYQTNREEFKELLNQFNSISEVQWIEDDAITRGGCRIETQHGQINQEIETQLDRILSELIS